ncbi:MAG: helix-turn-helix domain-containing protein [Olegusella sp.]|nr:helix-turn-helix domain-containing protein [Olegusella sp.]
MPAERLADGGSTDGGIARALLTIIGQKPYARITMAEVARAANVDRATCYWHFGGKDEIVSWYLRRYLEECTGRFRESGAQDMRSYLMTVFTVTLERKDDMLAIYRSGAAHLLLGALSEAFRMESLSRSADPLAQYAVAYHVGGIYSDMLLWFERGMAETPAQMTQVALASRPAGAFTLLDFG